MGDPRKRFRKGGERGRGGGGGEEEEEEEEEEEFIQNRTRAGARFRTRREEEERRRSSVRIYKRTRRLERGRRSFGVYLSFDISFDISAV